MLRTAQQLLKKKEGAIWENDEPYAAFAEESGDSV
jgi:hypothetical protein